MICLQTPSFGWSFQDGRQLVWKPAHHKQWVVRSSPIFQISEPGQFRISVHVIQAWNSWKKCRYTFVRQPWNRMHQDKKSSLLLVSVHVIYTREGNKKHSWKKMALYFCGWTIKWHAPGLTSIGSKSYKWERDEVWMTNNHIVLPVQWLNCDEKQTFGKQFEDKKDQLTNWS